jgi:HSP20 family molecular chaperone IbpA
MFYTNIDKLVNSLVTQPMWFDGKTIPLNNYQTEYTEDGKIKLVVNVLGHNPKDVEIEVNNGELHIKAQKPEGAPLFVKNINLSFVIGREYDETSADATIENGLLTLTLDKKEDMKSKKIKIKF